MIEKQKDKGISCKIWLGSLPSEDGKFNVSQNNSQVFHYMLFHLSVFQFLKKRKTCFRERDSRIYRNEVFHLS